MSGEKYLLFDVPEDDVSPLFTTKLQEDARLKGNEVLESPDFGAELRDLFETLQHDGPLKDLLAMRQFCHGHPQARMSDRQTFYAFRIDTSRYRYYLRLFPQKRKFYLFCYQTDQFREGRPEPDFNYIYRKNSRKKLKSRGER